ncbi:AMP-binding protein [Rhodoligotrophos ferricapiens]|uniref:AMP-binding protein n=1 Tax=Rhodoligotrophos ferricapiens TaxID=3069264 RepID=UPI00315D51E9
MLSDQIPTGPQAAAAQSPLFSLFERPAASAPFLILPDRVVTYGEVSKRAHHLAAGLHAARLRRGDRIALMLPNTPEWLVIAAACWRLGVAVMALNVRLGTKELGDLVARTESKAIFYAPNHRDGACAEVIAQTDPAKLASLRWLVACDGGTALSNVADATPLSLAEIENSGQESPDQNAVESGGPQDPCLFLATSGTTSAPKLVTHIQERVARHAQDCARTIGFDDESKVLLAIPFCGGYGFTIAISTIAGGRPLVLMDNFDPAEAARLIKEHAVSHAMGTNDMLDKMLKATDAEAPFPSLKFYGHANFTPGLTELPAEAERRKVTMRGFYGLSETLAFVAAQSLNASLERRAEGGGRLVCPDARFRIRDPETGRSLGPGEVGEIEINTPNMMIGYLNDPEKTRAAITSDGYLRTGDFGQIADDGGFTFISRMNDMLRIGGYLVSPVEIEDVIKATGNIETCQVVSVETDKGVRPVAFVVPSGDGGIDEKMILQRCRAELAVYKVPVAIFEIRDLPVVQGPNGVKVKKHELRNIAKERLAAAR